MTKRFFAQHAVKSKPPKAIVDGMYERLARSVKVTSAEDLVKRF